MARCSCLLFLYVLSASTLVCDSARINSFVRRRRMNQAEIQNKIALANLQVSSGRGVPIAESLQLCAQKQLEYYFTDENLHRDKFMLARAGALGDGFIKVADFRSFARLVSMAEDVTDLSVDDLVLAGAAGSLKLQISQDGLSIQRLAPLPKNLVSRHDEVDIKAVVIEEPLSPQTVPGTVADDFATRAFLAWEELIRKGIVINVDAKDNPAEVTRLLVRRLFSKQAFGKLITVISVMTRLEVLDLSYNRIGDRRISSLASVWRPGRLKVLELYGNAITDTGARKLAFHLPKMTNLQELRLGSNNIRNEGAKYLAAELIQNDIMSTSHLKVLSLAGNEIGDAAALALCIRLQTMTSLKELYLGFLTGNQIYLGYLTGNDQKVAGEEQATNEEEVADEEKAATKANAADEEKVAAEEVAAEEQAAVEEEVAAKERAVDEEDSANEVRTAGDEKAADEEEAAAKVRASGNRRAANEEKVVDEEKVVKEEKPANEEKVAN